MECVATYIPINAAAPCTKGAQAKYCEYLLAKKNVHTAVTPKSNNSELTLLCSRASDIAAEISAAIGNASEET